MKGILIAALLLASSSVFAADLSSVGTTGVEGTTDYSYLRSIGTQNYTAQHEAQVGVQVNAGALGSLSAAAGDTRDVSSNPVNFPTFTVGYANGIKLGHLLGGVGLVGAVDYSTLTGDKWFFSGKNSASPSHQIAGTAEVNLPVGFVVTHWLINVRPYVNYTYVHMYDQPGSASDAAASVGIYATPTTFAPRLVTKVGYQRTTQDGNAQGVVASLNYKF
jgi:hypothetical protein